MRHGKLKSAFTVLFFGVCLGCQQWLWFLCLYSSVCLTQPPDCVQCTPPSACHQYMQDHRAPKHVWYVLCMAVWLVSNTKIYSHWNQRPQYGTCSVYSHVSAGMCDIWFYTIAWDCSVDVCTKLNEWSPFFPTLNNCGQVYDGHFSSVPLHLSAWALLWHCLHFLRSVSHNQHMIFIMIWFSVWFLGSNGPHFIGCLMLHSVYNTELNTKKINPLTDAVDTKQMSWKSASKLASTLSYLFPSAQYSQVSCLIKSF